MKIVLSKSFLKQLKKLGSVEINDMKKLLRKYPTSKNIVEIDRIDKFKILKCYLLHKKIRSIIFLRVREESYIPIAIIKKESRKGENIIKENYWQLFNGEIRKTFEDLEKGNFEVEEA